MTEEADKPKWAKEDMEALFASIGRYVSLFQWMEGLLDQILLLGWGHENWTESQDKLARLSNFDKIEAVKSLLLESPDFERLRSRSGWLADFEELITRLHEERDRRNSLLHSQMIWRLVEYGIPPVRATRRRVEGGSSAFDYQQCTPAAQEELVNNLVFLGLDVNDTYVQVVQDYRNPNRDASGLQPKLSSLVRELVKRKDD